MARLYLFLFILFFNGVIPDSIGSPLYFFNNYTVRDGLSNKNVRAIIKDRNGFIWVGTSGGLNRFNGVEFKVYKNFAGDSTTVCSNYISDLLVDHNKRLWVSGIGICYYNEKKDNFQRVPVKLENGRLLNEYEIFFMHEDTRGQIWAGTNGIGLLRLNKKDQQFEEVKSSTLLNSKEFVSSFQSINSILEEPDGTFWLSGTKHIFKYSPDENSIKAFGKLLPGDAKYFQSLSLFQPSNDKRLLWIGTWGKGLVQFDKLSGKFQSFTFESGMPVNLSNIVLSFYRKSDSLLWLGTNKGIYEFNESTKNYIRIISDSLNEKPTVNVLIKTFYKDSDNTLWIGSATGLSCLDPLKQSFVANRVWNKGNNYAFPNQISDTIYAAMYYQNRTLVSFSQSAKTEQAQIIPGADQLRAEPFHLLKDHHNNVWIGTTKGLYRYNEISKQIISIPLNRYLQTEDKPIYIHDIVEDNKNNIWFACSPVGLIKYNYTEKTFIDVSTLADKKHLKYFDGITRLGVDNNQNVVSYSVESGFLFINDANYTMKTLPPNSKYPALFRSGHDFTIANDGTIWLTTTNNGLIRINTDGVVRQYTHDSTGELIDNQQSLTLDEAGSIWLTANRGLFRFNPSTEFFTQYGIHDGLPFFAETPSLYKFSDGQIGFTIEHGLFKFNPLEFHSDSSLLYVHFTEVNVNEKKYVAESVIDYTDTLQLNYNQNNITFYFAATNYSSPQLTQYSYMIEGIQNTWTKSSSTPIINLTRLQPGEYTLIIKAGITSIPSDAPPKTIFIKIIPAWWQTIQFRAIAFIVFLILLVSLIKYIILWRYKQQIIEMKHTNEIEQIRARISRDIHDDIGAGLTKINFLSRGLTKKINNTQAAIDLASKISLSSEELIQNLGEIVWAINPENDSLENLIAFIRIYLSRQFDEYTELSLSLDLPDPDKIPKDIMISPDVKSNLVMIIKESVNNIIKHAKATSITVKLTADRKIIHLTIIDDGKGIFINNENPVSGNGIKNMHKRANSINAQLNIKPAENTGTTIILSVPIN